MAIRIAYKKTYLTGALAGKTLNEYQDTSQWGEALHLSNELKKINRFNPVEDPFTGNKCFVSSIRVDTIKSEQHAA